MLYDLRQRIGGADRRSVARSLGLSILGLTLATGVVSLLQSPSIGVRDASSVYLVVVVLVGAAAGTGAALWTAVMAFVAYDFLFTEPRYSLAVADPGVARARPLSRRRRRRRATVRLERRAWPRGDAARRRRRRAVLHQSPPGR